MKGTRHACTAGHCTAFGARENQKHRRAHQGRQGMVLTAFVEGRDRLLRTATSEPPKVRPMPSAVTFAHAPICLPPLKG